MRIYLGHHFYGAGNLGDDFMLAGFLAAMRTVAPGTHYSACVPFPLDPLRSRFPEIDWQPYTDAARAAGIASADAWLGLGGSPFQSAQSRWFVDHLLGDQQLCQQHRKPMFFLGVGVQAAAELEVPDVRALCANASAIWTRDAASAQRLAQACPGVQTTAAADFAHVFFAGTSPPAPTRGRLTLVANFDYGTWPGQGECLAACDALAPRERVWLAQESRTLPGAEHALFDALPASEKARWQLAAPEVLGAPLRDVLTRWPSGEWLVTSRYHAALAGAWAGSKVVIIATNEKLRGAATDLGMVSLSPTATRAEVTDVLARAGALPAPQHLAERALRSCREFVAAAQAA